MPDTRSIAQALDAWRELLGDAQVDDAAAAQRRYGADTSGERRQLVAALRLPAPLATSRNGRTRRADIVDELISDLLAVARAHRLPLHPISTGRNWGYGTALPATTRAAVLLDLGSLDQIEFDADGLGVVCVEPGVTQGMLAERLQRERLDYLVPCTGAGPSCSLLANALERGYGVTPTTDHYAAVTSLEAVMADGSRYRGMLSEAGGTSLAGLFKWGLGPHAQGLFTQSGLGIVTRMSIALAPRPEVVQVCLFGLAKDEHLEQAVPAIRTLLQRLPGVVGALNLMNRHRVLSMSAPYPWDELGEDGLIKAETLERLGRQYQVQAWTGFCTLYGTKATVAAARAELRRALGGIAVRLMFVTPERAQTLVRLAALLPRRWGAGVQRLTQTLRSSLALVSGTPGETALPLAYWRHRDGLPAQTPLDPGRHGCGLRWYAPLVPMHKDKVRGYVAMVHEVTRRHGIEPLITFTTLGDRLFDSTVPILFDRHDAQAVDRAGACAAELLEAGQARGYFPYRLGVGDLAKLERFAPEAVAWHRRLRQTWDPDDLLAPGRYC